ncbi:MAG: hypothetical protein J5903_02025, partial [Clostridia bacterium]|nr:hypothetical protein [Clostridia bacterium]
MKNANENTVSAVNQINATADLSFLGDPNAPLKVLVVGNSILRHSPKADIGWNNDWGMAASAQDKDFVHRLYAKLTESGKNVYMRIRQCAEWEVGFLNEGILKNYDGERDFRPDVFVFRLGENVAEQNKPLFKDAM